LSKLETLIQDAHRHYSNFSVHLFMREVRGFIDALSRWYLRRSRRRFWKSEDDGDKTAAYLTLWECLVTVIKLLAPIVPFMTDAMYRDIARPYGSDTPLSVHLCDFPKPDSFPIDERLVRLMDVTTALVEHGHSARSKAKLKVRQPIREVRVLTNQKGLEHELQPFGPLILDELNAKKLTFIGSATDLYSVSARVDAKLGKPKYRQLFEAVQAELSRTPAESIVGAVERGEPIPLMVNGEALSVGPNEIVIQRSARSDWEMSEGNGLFVAIDTKLDAQLIGEGLVRDLIREIQNLRKEVGFEVADRIRVRYAATGELADAIVNYMEYLANETLAVELTATDVFDETPHSCRVGNCEVKLSISRI
jgi:isoleucyl-tRNA synthetase